MKKVLFMAAVAAAGLSSCSNEVDVAENPVQAPAEVGAVTFDAYTARNTRGTVNTITTLQAATGGFGVYAYDQNTLSYSNYSASSSFPNFMHNQKVYYDTDWKYAPTKYYNNNEGAKHSFFAYAPYDANIQTVFDLNKAPQIRYTASQDIDLLYADPVLNLPKPGVNHKVQFDFKHALSKLNIYVAPFVDQIHNDNPEHTTDDGLDANTTIVVKSVGLVGTVASQALLNLGDGSWTYEITNEHAYDIEKEVTLDDNNSTNPADHSNYKPVSTDMMVIPSIANGKVKVRVVYDVITNDTKHPENSSKRTCVNVSEDGIALLQGQAYKLYLDLGLTSVKLNAEVVDDWITNSDDLHLDIPNNSDWHPYAYVTPVGIAIPTPQAVHIVSGKPAIVTENDYYYNTANGIMYKGGTSNAWALYPTASIFYDEAAKKYFDVTATTGVTTVYNGRAAYVNSTYYIGKDPVTLDGTYVVYSLNVNSNGQIQTGADAAVPASWTDPDPGKFYTYTVGDVTYLLQWGEPTPPAP